MIWNDVKWYDLDWNVCFVGTKHGGFRDLPVPDVPKDVPNQIFVEIASVSRDKIRSGLMCILQFSSMSDPSWMVLVLDSWGRSWFGHLWSNPKGSQLTHPKKNVESIFWGYPQVSSMFFHGNVGWLSIQKKHPAGHPHQSSRRFLMDLEHHRWPSCRGPKDPKKPGKLIGFQAIHGYPPSKIGKSWKIEKEKTPPKTMGISFVNNFFLSIFP